MCTGTMVCINSKNCYVTVGHLSKHSPEHIDDRRRKRKNGVKGPSPSTSCAGKLRRSVDTEDIISLTSHRKRAMVINTSVVSDLFLMAILQLIGENKFYVRVFPREIYLLCQAPDHHL